MRRVLYILLLLMLCSVGNLYAQFDKPKLIGAYCYRFAEYTYWYNEPEYTNFEILLFTNNQSVIEEFNRFSQSKSIKNKPIKVLVGDDVATNIDLPVRMVVLCADMIDWVDNVRDMLDQKPVLLVTEDYNDAKNVMINLFATSDNQMMFEVNKANILLQNLVVDPEILLLGGTEIDLADLYRSSQLELEQLQKRLFDVTDSVASMQLLIDEAMVVLDERQKQIEKQERLLNAQNNELIAGKLEIQNQKNDLLNHKNQLKKQEQQLNDQVALIAKHQSDIDKQKDSMAVQLYEINSARAKLDSLIHEIDVQNEYLSNQYSVIKRQRVSLLMAAIAGFMTLILLVVLYVSFRGKIRHNRILKEQKQHIENVNQKMKRVNQHLYGIIARLRETQTQLITAEKMASLGVLTAGVAHEINNPINFIYTGINSLENDYNDLVQFFEGVLNSVAEKPDMRQHLKQATDNSDYYELIEIIPQTIKDIKVGAERAADIVKGLRNFSRIDKDSMQPANIHDGIDSAILLLRNKFKYHVEVVKEYGKVPVVMCYPGKLNQVFLNILSNAIDAISDKGRITIKTYTQKEYLIISFHDNGKGIAPEILDKVFDPFFTTKTVGQGVGLGLSISYSIIQEHNGHIEVKSNKNSGTEFTISLPCIDLQNEEK